MAWQETDNPFIPGPGTPPPHLAGRANEKAELEQALVRIKKKTDRRGRLKRVSQTLVLIGPRGVGKTALLGWVDLEAEKKKIRRADLSEEVLGGPAEDLGLAVMGKKPYTKATRKRTSFFSWGIPDLLSRGRQTTKPAGVSGLRSIIEEQLRRGPLLLLLDEAHGVEPELLRRFFIATQEFVRNRRPLALVLAGTPGLEGSLMGIGATFMERSRFMSLNLLSRDEAREALSVPAKETGVPMEEDALEALVEWTDCYPFFIQVAGEEAWKAAKGRDASGITLDDAKKALDVAGERRRAFYKRRYRELVSRELKAFALQAIAMIEAKEEKSISYDGLLDGFQAANDGMEHAEAVDVFQRLNDLGFVYENEDRFEAGIPSLFDYVKEAAAA